MALIGWAQKRVWAGASVAASCHGVFCSAIPFPAMPPSSLAWISSLGVQVHGAPTLAVLYPTAELEMPGSFPTPPS